MLERIPLEIVPLGKKDPAWMELYKAGEFKQGSKTLKFRLYVPALEEGRQYPLVLWLHGVKGRGDDNQRQITAGNSHGPAFFASEAVQQGYPCIVLVPQCPSGKFWVNFVNNRIRRSLKRALTLLEYIKLSYPVDADRVYVGGQSMGAFATWALLAEHPKAFAAGLPIAGGGSKRKAKRSISAPVWIFHGGADPIVRVVRSREMAETLAAAEKPHIYTEFPNGKHDIWPQVFEEPGLAEWLFGMRLPERRRR